MPSLQKLSLALSLTLLSFLTLKVSANLIISEVYFAGTDEWIELYNPIDADFSGNITISWAKSSNLILNNIRVPKNDFILLGDNLSDLIDRSKIIWTWLGLSISDTLNLSIKLIYSWSIIDEISADATTIWILKSKPSSLQKINSWWIYLTTSESDYMFNITGWKFANPWAIYTIPTLPWTWSETTGTNSTWFIDTWVVITWTILTGTNNTGFSLTGDCSTLNDSIRVTEIFAWNEKFSPYIELYAEQNFSWKIFFSGSLLTQGFTIDINIDRWQNTIVTATANWWLSTSTKIVNISLSLALYSGSLFLSRQNWQLLDNLEMKGLQTWESIYFSYQSGCVNHLEKADFFSPGFDENLFYYFSWNIQTREKIVEIEKIIYVETWSNSCPITTPPNDTNTTLATWTNSGTGDISIVWIDFFYNTIEKIQALHLKSSLAYDLNMKDYRVALSWRSTKNITYGILYSGQISIFTGRFYYPYSGWCVSLYSWTLILDTFCYDNNTTNISDTWDATEPEEDTINYTIKITNIIYDPSWSDAWNEKIFLTLQWFNSIDLSNLRLKINGTTTKRIYWILSNVGEQIFTSTFGFPNTKDSCVEIQKDGVSLDRYCYQIPKESESEESTLEDLKDSVRIKFTYILPNANGKDDKEEIGLWVTSDLTGVNLKDWYYLLIWWTKKKYLSWLLQNDREEKLLGNFGLPNTSSCVSIARKDKVFDTICYNNPQEWKKFLENNEAIEAISTIDLSILNKVKLKKSWPQICATFSWQSINCKTYSFKTIDGDELKLYKNYVTALNNYLQTNRAILFYNSRVKQYTSLLQEAKSKLKDWQTNVLIDRTWLTIYEIEQRFDKKYNNSLASKLEEIIPQKIFSTSLIKTIYEVRKKYFTDTNT